MITPSRPDVCLVTMPYAPLDPSLALGILESCLRMAEISVHTVYANLLFAERVSVARYRPIAMSYGVDLVGEWTFSSAAFGASLTDDDSFFSVIQYPPGEVESAARYAKKEADSFVDDLAEKIVKLNPRIVGCSSTFHQTCASLALLRRVRELEPSIITMLGGANCETPMGNTLQRCVPWLDYVVSGEADDIIVELCANVLKHGRDVPPELLPGGVVTRRTSTASTGGPLPQRPLVHDMDTVPIPTYDAYYATVKEISLEGQLSQGIPVETSRGCWWGQKHQCTFCGLAGKGMAFRSKSPDRVKYEFETLSRRYGKHAFGAVDSILNMNFFDSVLAAFSSRTEPFQIFFETKANLRREHVRRLSEAGVRWIQAGIEALHDQILKSFNKGTSALANVELMKWCREHGIWLGWGFLTDFPREKDEWYAEIAEWLPLISHLQPPQFITRVLLNRNSPYFDRASDYELDLVPSPAYRHVYPFSEGDLADLAYFFEDRAAPPRALGPGKSQFAEAVSAWQRAFKRLLPPILSYTVEDSGLSVLDSRPCAIRRRHRLDGLQAATYQACETATSISRIASLVNESLVREVEIEEVSSILSGLIEDRLVLSLNNRFLALAVPGTVPPIASLRDFPLDIVFRD